MDETEQTVKAYIKALELRQKSCGYNDVDTAHFVIGYLQGTIVSLINDLPVTKRAKARDRLATVTELVKGQIK